MKNVPVNKHKGGGSKINALAAKQDKGKSK